MICSKCGKLIIPIKAKQINDLPYCRKCYKEMKKLNTTASDLSPFSLNIKRGAVDNNILKGGQENEK